MEINIIISSGSAVNLFILILQSDTSSKYQYNTKSALAPLPPFRVRCIFHMGGGRGEWYPDFFYSKAEMVYVEIGNVD